MRSGQRKGGTPASTSLPLSPPLLYSTSKASEPLFVTPAGCGGPLFSYSYELLFPQALYFDNHPNCPGVYPSDLPRSDHSLGDSVASPVFSSICSLFGLSLLSFSTSRSLFSTACSLFSQTTRVGGASVALDTGTTRWILGRQRRSTHP